MKKAQFSVEFLFAAGAILLLFSIILGFTYHRQTELKELKEYLEINDECQRLANIISSLNIAGSGSEFYTKVNHNLMIYDINDEIYGSEIIIEPENISCFYMGNIENNIKITATQHIRIGNERGIITIENV